ncbi:MAG TPA: RDD family protein [Acidobacteriaceae bacterium]|nr:RDD family protein [Acidobacteriaceae bacterium]
MEQYPRDLQTARPGVGDQLSIATPELVAIEFPLAGLGSRFVAVLLDYLLQAAVVIILTIVFLVLLSGLSSRAVGGTGASAAGGDLSTKWTIAILIAIPFLLEWAYFALFEAFWHGQTPGKRIMKIRVIQQTGRPVSLFESLGRNLVRIIDMLPTAYAIGVICMFITKSQQRLGDLIAGTLVVHERPLEAPLESIGSSRTFTSGVFQPAVAAPPPRVSQLPTDAVARLTMADLQTLEHYLARRLDVPMETRAMLAARISQNIAQKMNYAIPDGMHQEAFLEEAAYALRSLPQVRR